MAIRSRGAICAAIVALIFTGFLSGCAEFNTRGGILAAVGDTTLFPARTKSHRLFRAYILTAALATVARNVGVGTADKPNLSGRIRSALEVEYEAYECLYPNRARLNWVKYDESQKLEALTTIKPPACIFFDERMARVDYAIYKLAAEVLTDPDSQALFVDVRDRLLGGLPVIGSGIRTIAKAVNTTKEAATTALETTSLVDSLINLSIKVAPRYVYLAPIYRDAIEMEMRLVIDELIVQCAASGDRQSPACAMVTEGQSVFAEGNGDISFWRHFLKAVSNSALKPIEADPVHFAVVTRWFYYACADIYAGATLTPGKFEKSAEDLNAFLTVAEDTVNKNCSPLIEYIPLSKTAPFRSAIKISFVKKRKDENDDDDRSVTASRRPKAPAVQPAQVPIPPEAARARGQQN